MKELPIWYQRIQRDHASYTQALERLGHAAREAGPLDEKCAQLVQLAAAAAVRSEGAVHSHTRRALEAGATREEIIHAVILTTSTVGFPTVSAALRWAEDIISKPDGSRDIDDASLTNDALR